MTTNSKIIQKERNNYSKVIQNYAKSKKYKILQNCTKLSKAF